MGSEPQAGAEATPAPGTCAAVAERIARLGAAWRWGILAFIAAATASVCAAVGFFRWRIGLIDEWTWPYYGEPVSIVLALPAVFLGLLLIAAVVAGLRLRTGKAWHEAVVVAVCLVLAFGVIVTMADAGPGGRSEALLANGMPWIGGYWSEATRVQEMGEYLRGYHAHIARLEVNDKVMGHISDHPPGPVVFHWLVNRAMGPSDARGPAWPKEEAGPLESLLRRQGAVPTPANMAGLDAVAWLFLLGYALALLPVYLIGRELLSREAGLMALGLAAFIPSAHLFGPYPDQLFLLFAGWSFYAWVMAMRRRSMFWAAVSGGVLFIGFLWTMAHLMVLALIGVSGLFGLWSEAMERRGRPEARPWLKIILAWWAAFALGILVVRYALDCRIVEVWRVCMAKHATFATFFPRSRWGWTLFNPLEFALFIGMPAFLLAALAAGADARRWWGERRGSAPVMMVWAVPIVIAALNLSGKNLGETARLWLPLMPLACVGAAAALDGLDRRRGWVTPLLLAMMLAQLTVFRLHLSVFSL
jgi:hypothetical protein